MKYNNYYLTDNISLDIYKDKKIYSLFNDYNVKTSLNVEKIEKLLCKGVFKVPYYEKETAWGYETIYFPFTNKLFKIINTKYNDTSLQLHPIKNEIWYPLKDVVINDGIRDINVDKSITINIPSRTVHNLLKDSIVFEVQDNIVFEYDETYRIFDKCNRDIQLDKFNAFHFLNNNKIDLINDKLIIKKQKLKTDCFIYSKEMDVLIKYNNKQKLIKKNELWFLSKETIILNNIEDVIIVESKYIRYI